MEKSKGTERMRDAFLKWLTIAAISMKAGPAMADQPLVFVMSDRNIPVSYSEEDGKAKGLMADLMSELVKHTRGIKVTIASMPWVRAQKDVQSRKAQLFCTYPSEERKSYALFSKKPLFSLDYGYLLYHKNSPRAQSIRQATRLADLDKFVFVSQKGVSWEDENIPKSVRRAYVYKLEALLHMVFGRQSGDFFVMPIEQASYYFTTLGYKAVAGIHPVDFIPNSKVELHLGVNKDIPGARKILDELERAMESKEFMLAKELIVKNYRQGDKPENLLQPIP